MTLEKIQALEKEVASLKGQKKTGRALLDAIKDERPVMEGQLFLNNLLEAGGKLKKREEDERRMRQLQELDSVLKDLMKANAPEARKRAIDILDRILKTLQQPEKKDQSKGPEPGH